MTRRRKRVERLLARPASMRFSELRTILVEDLGFIEPRKSNGSHHFFYKKGYGTIPIPIHGGQSVKTEYLDQVCKLLKLDEVDPADLDIFLDSLV